MVKKPTLAALMTPFPYAIGLEAPITEAAVLMADHGIHHLPVIDGQSLTGIISARDIADRDTRPWLVRDVHTPDPYVVDLGTALEEVLFKMAERHIGCAIVTRHGKLAGIFTHVDACRGFAAFIRELYPLPPDDLVA
jgi:acetoin utilization protein AcuB